MQIHLVLCAEVLRYNCLRFLRWFIKLYSHSINILILIIFNPLPPFINGGRMESTNKLWNHFHSLFLLCVHPLTPLVSPSGPPLMKWPKVLNWCLLYLCNIARGTVPLSAHCLEAWTANWCSDTNAHWYLEATHRETTNKTNRNVTGGAAKYCITYYTFL